MNYLFYDSLIYLILKNNNNKKKKIIINLKDNRYICYNELIN